MNIVQKVSFDVVDCAFEKIAKYKHEEDNNVKKSKRSMAAQSLLGSAWGAATGANIGSFAAKVKNKPQGKGAAIGAVIGAGSGALASLKHSLEHNRAVDKENKEKTAFDVVDCAFDKIAKKKDDKEDIDLRGLRRNVTGRSVGAGLVGAGLGAYGGAIAAHSKGYAFIPPKYVKAGAGIGAGINAANSIRKSIKHNRSIDSMSDKLNDKNAFDLSNNTFEKLAEKMPYTTPDGNYAVPMGWSKAQDVGEDDIDGTWQNDFYRKENQIPSHHKRIADNPFGDAIFVDTNSDKSNPKYYSNLSDVQGEWQLNNEEVDRMFSTSELKNKNFGKLKENGLASTRGIAGLDKDQLREFGYTDPTFKDKANSFGRMAKRSAKTIGRSALMGGVLGGGIVGGKTLKSLGKNVAIGSGLGALSGVGLNAAGGGFKLDDSSNARVNKIKESLKSDYYTDSENADFLNQYKSASELVDSCFE